VSLYDDISLHDEYDARAQRDLRRRRREALDPPDEDEQARTRELLNWPVDDTLVCRADDLRAAVDAALSEGD
jgi:hypothetical protein